MSAEARRKIRQTIQELGRAGSYEIHQGKVVSVDNQALTIDVEIEGLTYYDVRLRAVVTDDSGFYVVPTAGSYVTIAQIEGGVDHVLIRASEIDRVYVKIGQSTLQIDADGAVFNGGNLDGVPKSNNVADKLSTIENQLNQLKSLLQGVLSTPVTEPGNGAPSAFQVALNAALTTWLSQTFTPTTADMIKNTKLKQ